MEIEIKYKITNNILYSHNCNNNTIKKTVEEAIKNNADLRNANLTNADLRNADLHYANLYNADLRYANLTNANLHYANLYNADLRYANLYNADLRYANLYNADLYNANLNKLNTIAVSDHNLLSQILFQNATTRKHREWAGFIAISIDYCWDDFLKEMSKPCINWCISILSKWPEFKEYYENERKIAK